MRFEGGGEAHSVVLRLLFGGVVGRCLPAHHFARLSVWSCKARQGLCTVFLFSWSVGLALAGCDREWFKPNVCELQLVCLDTMPHPEGVQPVNLTVS